MPIEQDANYDARKLHEVCINHRLAIYLEKYVMCNIDTWEDLFADIEFNREGVNFKTVSVNGEILVVRPDIIIHNRKTGNSKFNFLIVECKKSGASEEELAKDGAKICALMCDARYEYQFGLRILYGEKSILGLLHFHDGLNVVSERIDYP
jgi:hypothetical protein